MKKAKGAKRNHKGMQHAQLPQSDQAKLLEG
jgi:hypothetical protein